MYRGKELKFRAFKTIGMISSFIVGLGLKAFAQQPLVSEAPQKLCTSSFSMSITTFSWTVVPSSNCAGRVGIYVNALSSNTGTVRCIPTSSSTLPVSSTSTFAVWENVPSSNAMFLGLQDNQYLWCLTTHTSAETISGVEVKQ